MRFARRGLTASATCRECVGRVSRNTATEGGETHGQRQTPLFVDGLQVETLEVVRFGRAGRRGCSTVRQPAIPDAHSGRTLGAHRRRPLPSARRGCRSLLHAGASALDQRDATGAGTSPGTSTRIGRWVNIPTSTRWRAIRLTTPSPRRGSGGHPGGARGPFGEDHVPTGLAAWSATRHVRPRRRSRPRAVGSSLRL